MRRAVQLRNTSHFDPLVPEPIDNSASVHAAFNLDSYVSIPHLNLNTTIMHVKLHCGPWGIQVLFMLVIISAVLLESQR